MEKIYFSAENFGFYPDSMREEYYNGGGWPPDAVEISIEKWMEFSSSPPEGMTLGSDDAGYPSWTPACIPKLTTEQKIDQNKDKAMTYLSFANQRIEILYDATNPEIMGDDIYPGDIDLLKNWRAYRVKLSRISDFLIPEWPDMPE